MSKKLNICSIWLTVLMALSACAPPQAAPTAAPTAVPVQDSAATQTAVAVADSQKVATSVAATLTAQPSDTPLPPASDTPEPRSTATPEPSATATATDVPPTQTPTRVVVVSTPLPTNTTAPTVSASVYSTASGGPQGYTSLLGCTQVNGTPCQTVMTPGDISFSITLRSAEDAVLAIFLPFGLSVEKDGVNLPDMYMTVDAGWLPPGSQARMGTSRSFTQPGHYVVRTNGCLLTEASYPQCTWWTVNGTIVSFDIQ